MKVNQRNPAVKRILADVRELAEHSTGAYHANPLEDNMFEWHFTIRGPPGTAFEGGVYHGRILLPAEYPFKPPNIVFMTPNGRFEVGTKICLSISAYHPEHWQPAWGVRTILEALISFLPTEGNGAIGALDWTAEERQRLARESVNFECPICGRIADCLPEQSASTATAGVEGKMEDNADEPAPRLHLHYVGDSGSTSTATTTAGGSDAVQGKSENEELKEEVKQVIDDQTSVSGASDDTGAERTAEQQLAASLQRHDLQQTQQEEQEQQEQQEQQQQQQQEQAAIAQIREQQEPEPEQQQHRQQSGRDFVDDMLLALMVVIGLAVLYLTARKFAPPSNYSFPSGDL